MNSVGYSFFRPKGHPRAVVVVVHGMAEHRQRYRPFAEFLKDRGYAVLTYDLIGHGENVEEVQGYFGKHGWKRLVDSVTEAVRMAKKAFPGAPAVLFGHSMGTMLSRCYIQAHDDEIRGMILTGPPNWQAASAAGIVLGTAIRAVKGKKAKSALMDKLVTGNFNKSIANPKTPVDWLSFNPENVQNYLNDEMCGFGFTVQGYVDELMGMNRMNDLLRYRHRNPSLPIALFAGEEDPTIGGKRGFRYTARHLRLAGYRNVRTRLYSHMRHEILNETEREQVFRDIVKWLDEHFAA